MRAAWVQAYALDAHIGDLEADLVLLNENRPGQSATNHPRLLFLLGVERGVVIPTDRWDAAAVGGKKELDRVKGERVKLIAQATGLAKDAAVYEHPRLANTDTKLSGDINITIKKY